MNECTNSVLPPPEVSAFASWAKTASAGDDDLAQVIMNCVSRFRRRHSCLFIDAPGPGYAALVRIFRSVAVLTDVGTVRSAELFRIRNVDAFFADPRERTSTIAATGWDDKAALFTPRQPPRLTRDVPSLIDWSGAACARTVPDQVRQFEYLLNADLHRDKRADLLLDVIQPARSGASSGGVGSHRPLRAEHRQVLEEILRSLILREAPAALNAFRARLDEARLSALAGAGANGVTSYNWLCGLDRRECDPQLALRRTQAACAYPIAWSLLSKPFGPVADAVSEARPLGAALAHTLSVPEKALRRINGLGIEGAGLAGSPDPDTAAELIRKATRMPPGQAPRTPTGWRAFFAALSLSDAVDNIRGRGRETGALGATLLASSAGKWDSLDHVMLAQAAGGIQDMIQDFHANVAEPVARLHEVRGWSVSNTLERVVGGRSLTQLAEASRWWHDQQADIRARLAALFPPKGSTRGVQSWPPLHAGGAWQATNGLMVVPLTDEDMLLAEHQQMHHCINRYAPNALFNGAHLLSVRSAANKSLGTVEISQDTILPLAKSMREPPNAPLMELPPGVAQFRGENNSTPRLEAWEALWEYVSAILTGAIKIDADFLIEDLARRREFGKGIVRSAACFDTGTSDALDEAWLCYSPLLPKSVAKRGPAALVGVPAPRQREVERAPAPGMGM